MHHRVLGLNESSIKVDMIKSYRKLALRYHPEKNRHPPASVVMQIINKAKEGFEYTLRYNDAMREKESVHLAQKYIEISSNSSS